MDTPHVLFALLWFAYVILHVLFFASIALTLWRCFADNPSNGTGARDVVATGAAVHLGMERSPEARLATLTAMPCRQTTKSVILPLLTAILSGYILYGP
jgi:hypothetical protein